MEWLKENWFKLSLILLGILFLLILESGIKVDTVHVDVSGYLGGEEKYSPYGLDFNF